MLQCFYHWMSKVWICLFQLLKAQDKNFKGKFLWLLLQHQRGGESAVARALKECAQKKGVLVNFQENQKKCWNLNTISKITCTKKEKKVILSSEKPIHTYFFQPFEVRSVFSKNRIRWDTDHGVMPIATKKASEIFFEWLKKVWWWICAIFVIFNSKFLELRIGKNINFCFHFSHEGGGNGGIYLEDFFLVYVHMKLCTL